MSSLTHETKTRNGYRLRVYTAAGRRSIWLGRITEHEAIAIQRHVDEIIAAQTADLPIPRATVQWMERQTADLRQKLRAITGAAHTLRAAVDLFLDDRREHLADSSFDDRSRSLDVLVDQFGDRTLERITVDDINRAHAAIPSGTSTRGKIAIHWRTFFAWCVDRKHLVENPARHLPTSIAVRDKPFVPAETIRDAIAMCRDPELGLVVALSRFAGIRISSEIRAMEWSHIDRERGRMRIIDTKRGRDRDVPIDPILAQQFDAQPAGELLSTLRTMSHAAITDRFRGLLHDRGIPVWSPLWHSMRASRETEWIRSYGVAIASQWIGNSVSVALRSYATIPADVWSRAAASNV